MDSRKLFIKLGFRVCNVIKNMLYFTVKKYFIVEKSAAAKKNTTIKIII